METITQETLTKADYKSYFEKGITYASYFENTSKEAEMNSQDGYLAYVPQNFQRMKRIPKTLKLTDKILHALKNIEKTTNWLLISENWCGDASQIVPVLDAVAQASEGKITLRMVYRDQNLELIDAHLTEKGRSIPKLIILDENFEVLNTWGPRPAEAQKLVIELKKSGATLAELSEILHKWYADNKQKAILDEIADLM